MRLRAVFIGCWLAVCSALGGAVGADPAQDQAKRQVEQPLNNAPAWREVRSGAAHTTQVRGRESGVLIQASGETWRQIRNGPVTLIGGALLILVPVAIYLFYRKSGPMKLHEPPSGRKIERFTRWERIVHWCTAVTFVILAVTGIVLLFGKHFLIPVIGYNAFSWLATVSKTLHNFVGPLFIFSVACMFFTYLRDNLWRKADWEWLRKAPLVLTGKAHVPSGKYNAAEKGWFWGGVAFLGLIVGASGLVLDFPNFDQTRYTMQVANIVHGIGALLFVLASFGHIYMGTIGTEGAYEGMKTGFVDEIWAKEHHELWYREVKAGARATAATPVQRAGAPG
ncbi:MAG TPA: formate dehydrogenase subunit gamma [Burkholderiales bacterium]|jgi:formate dehydrogenase subunit gamma|nr:formate dehydrogenase subunit gamma [Burkholderiales bacterium]